MSSGLKSQMQSQSSGTGTGAGAANRLSSRNRMGVNREYGDDHGADDEPD
jgi:hypothetical protein